MAGDDQVAEAHVMFGSAADDVKMSRRDANVCTRPPKNVKLKSRLCKLAPASGITTEVGGRDLVSRSLSGSG